MAWMSDYVITLHVFLDSGRRWCDVWELRPDWTRPQWVLAARPERSVACGTIVWNSVWWRHQMETFSALLALCAGNSSVNYCVIYHAIQVFIINWKKWVRAYKIYLHDSTCDYEERFCMCVDSRYWDKTVVRSKWQCLVQTVSKISSK